MSHFFTGVPKVYRVHNWHRASYMILVEYWATSPTPVLTRSVSYHHQQPHRIVHLSRTPEGTP